ncbi:MAG: hypothetical protein ACE145_04760 [Terriglobia bacterium]
MVFARRVLQVAGIYGLIVIVPMFFMETQIGRDYPPAITHPEYFYGFLCVTLAWQVLYLFMARDPTRYRLLLIPSILEKVGFPIAAVILLVQQRIPLVTFGFSMVDLILATLFVISYRRLAAPPA